MNWDDASIYRLRVLWDERLSTAEIGRRMGCSKNAIVGKSHRLNLEPRPSPINFADKPRIPKPKRAGAATLPKLESLKRAPRIPTPSTHRTPRPVALLRTVIAKPKLVAPVRLYQTCQFLGGDRKPYTVCTSEPKKGSVYCTDHHARCYTKKAA